MSDDNISPSPLFGTPCVVNNCVKHARQSNFIWHLPTSKQAKYDFCHYHASMVHELLSNHNETNLKNRQLIETMAFDAAYTLEIKLNKFFITGKLE